MASGTLITDYAGKSSRLFRLALWTSLLTVATLGIYRFWMKTRLRRYYWSAIRPGGQPMEYVGQPLEKLLGFLIAVVILAFYIGVVNLVLMFVSFSLVNNNFWAYAMSLLGILPILFYAKYRARRYILARTRWRGVRFGMQNGAWGYSWRALLHWAITLLTLGLLWPRMTFWLEKYLSDHTYFGSQSVVQGGHWGMLYRPFLPYLAGLIIIAGALVVWFQGSQPTAVLIGVLGLLVAIYGLVHYRVHSFRILTNNKSIGAIGFISQPRTWRVMGIYGFGYGLVAFFMVLIATGAFFGFSLLLKSYGLTFGEDFNLQILGTDLPIWVASAFSALTYFTVFIVWGALRHALVTLPLARHYTQTLTLTGTNALAQIDQRARDEMEQAEGFAEALDLGAAI